MLAPFAGDHGWHTHHHNIGKTEAAWCSGREHQSVDPKFFRTLSRWCTWTASSGRRGNRYGLPPCLVDASQHVDIVAFLFDIPMYPHGGSGRVSDLTVKDPAAGEDNRFSSVNTAGVMGDLAKNPQLTPTVEGFLARPPF